MHKKEISEIKRLYTKEKCGINRICGCYVNHEKEKVLCFKDAFLSIPEEEMYKYFDIFRKCFSGSLGKNLVNMEFPLEQEMNKGTQTLLLKLRDTELKEDTVLDIFYDQIIESYYHPENYLILLIHGTYDIPQRTNDGFENEDASDYVYSFIHCAICPVSLAKASLCYNEMTNAIEERIRDWIVEMPEQGFLFPAFNDRNTDIHACLYYSKDSKEFDTGLLEQVLGCVEPATAPIQRECFDTIVEEAFGDSCTLETICAIHENLNTLIDEAADDPAPVVLDKQDVKSLLIQSGAEEEKIKAFEDRYDELLGANQSVMASNIANTRKFELKTQNYKIQVNPDRTDLIETKIIDGREYLLIPFDDEVEVNGIHIYPTRED